MNLSARSRTTDRPNALRQEGWLPAIVYNADLNMKVAVETKAFDRVFRAQGLASLIDLDVDGDVHQVLVKAVQMDKRKRVPMHVDFFAITRGQKLNVAVPVELVGTSAGQRAGGQLDVKRREVTLSVLPSQIPSAIQLDISDLEIGSSLHVSDVKPLLPAGAEIVDDEGLTLVAVVASRVAASPTSDSVDEAEPESESD